MEKTATEPGYWIETAEALLPSRDLRYVQASYEDELEKVAKLIRFSAGGVHISDLAARMAAADASMRTIRRSGSALGRLTGFTEAGRAGRRGLRAQKKEFGAASKELKNLRGEAHSLIGSGTQANITKGTQALKSLDKVRRHQWGSHLRKNVGRSL